MESQDDQPTKLTLNVIERYAIHHMLPSRGDFVTIQRVKMIRQNLDLTEDEKKECNLIEMPNGEVRWDVKKARILRKDIELGSLYNHIRKVLIGLEENKQLEEKHIGLYKKFGLNKSK